MAGVRTVRGRAIAREVAKLANRRLLFSAETERAVARIVKDVRSKGDSALRRYAEKWDGLAPKQSLRVSEQELAAALASIPANLRHALETAAHNIRKFAEWQKPQEFTREIQPGLQVGQIIRPLDSVGCYVPGGRYPLAVFAADDRDSRAGRGRIAHRGLLAAPGTGDAGRGSIARRHRVLPHRRSPGHRRSCLRHEVHRSGREDRGSGQSVRHHREEAGLF